MSRRFSITELNELIRDYKRLTDTEGRGLMETYKILGEKMDRSPDVIRQTIRRFLPTTDAAESYLKAQALRLAVRVVRKANVDQSIDLLSRPNIGVIAPQQQQASSGGFFLSVHTESLGGMQIGISGSEGNLPSAASPAASGSSEPLMLDAIPEKVEELRPQMRKGVPHPNQGTMLKTGLEERRAKAMEVAKRKLAALRSKRAKAVARQVSLE